MELKAIKGGDIHDAVEFRRPANGEYPKDTEYYFKSEVDRVTANKDKEIAELKAKLEDVQASAYAESVDAGMRERRLKRALYKACANWAYWVEHALTTKFVFNNSSKTKLERDRWYNMEHKCLKKAEEYK